MGDSFDISVIVTAHREGRLAHRSMRSLFRSVEYAEARGVSVEIIVAMDIRAERETVNYFSSHQDPRLRVERGDYGDLGMTRNHGVSVARAKYCAFLDADDLFGETWLHDAFKYAEAQKADVVIHPEYHVHFEARDLVYRQISSLDAGFNVFNLVENNYWSALCFARRDILARYPYQVTTHGSGFGFEDWHFNCETLADGIEHHVAPGTVIFLRVKKSGSLLSSSMSDYRLLRPTRLMDPAWLSSIAKKKGIDAGKDAHNTPGAPARRVNTFNKWSGALKGAWPGLHSLASYLWQIMDERAQSARKKKAADALPAWLLDEWKKMNSIEPELYPERRRLESMTYYEVPRSRIGRHYLELCGFYGKNAGHVFLIPRLSGESAATVALNYVEAVRKNDPSSDVVVVATAEGDPHLAGRLSKGARLIEFGKLYGYLSPLEQEWLLARLLLQMAPGAVYNVDSELGYRLYVKYAKALRTVSSLYAIVFGPDLNKDWRMAGYPFTYLPDCFDSLTAVLSDNAGFLEELKTIYAFDEKKLLAHNWPVVSVKKE